MTQRDPSNRPIFVVGSPRSGTTLLQRMLRSHPNISSPTGESQFIISLHRRADKFGDLNMTENIRHVLHEMRRISREFIEEDLHGMQFDADVLARQFADRRANSIPKIVAALYETNASGEGKSRWLDKTPGYVRNLPIILNLFQNAQIIHIIRDGRDCCLSMLQRKHDLKIFNVYHAAFTWKSMVDAGQRSGARLGSKVYLEMRYEDLLRNPVRTMREVCEFLGEPYTNEVVEFQKSNDPYNKTPLLHKPLVPTNTKKWITGMRKRQVQVFEAIACDTLQRNGYPITLARRELKSVEKLLYEMHQRISEFFSRKKKTAARPQSHEATSVN